MGSSQRPAIHTSPFSARNRLVTLMLSALSRTNSVYCAFLPMSLMREPCPSDAPKPRVNKLLEKSTLYGQAAASVEPCNALLSGAMKTFVVVLFDPESPSESRSPHKPYTSSQQPTPADVSITSRASWYFCADMRAVSFAWDPIAVSMVPTKRFHFSDDQSQNSPSRI